MEIVKTSIDGLVIIQPKVFEDERGYFMESYKESFFKANFPDIHFIQDNESKSSYGVLRGLHFQKPPHAQAKLVSVIKGAVLDVAVDIRKNSPTYSQFIIKELNEENHLMMYLPEGIAHGFMTLQDDTIFSYKCSNYYNKESEDCLLWNDPIIDIQWPNIEPILSEKDQNAKNFTSFVSPF